MEKIVFLERDTFKVEFRRPQFDHEWIDYAETAPSQVVERLHEATIAICNKLPLRASDLSRLPQLKLIAVAATGVDNIDLVYCKQNGVAVCNAQHYAGNSLSEHVFCRRLPYAETLLRIFRTSRGSLARGKTVLPARSPDPRSTRRHTRHHRLWFFGEGRGKSAKAVGMELLIAERRAATSIRTGRVAFPEVLEASDVITLHCPLTDETRNLIDGRNYK